MVMHANATHDFATSSLSTLCWFLLILFLFLSSFFPVFSYFSIPLSLSSRPDFFFYLPWLICLRMEKRSTGHRESLESERMTIEMQLKRQVRVGI
ncbi:hypothetical protein F5Y07DRAFT_320123 [Xylaria sp. FL0933]|nr:hypothetical protein F5Y07DRAFT_320123 [Xylaria sp. FL0933]